MNIGQIRFNSGEISPKIDVRTDIEKYSGGCRRCENFIPNIYGVAKRRPGTEYIATVFVNAVLATGLMSNLDIAVCNEDIVVTGNNDDTYNTIICNLDDVICHEDEIVTSDVTTWEVQRIVCHNNNVIFNNDEEVIIN